MSGEHYVKQLEEIIREQQALIDALLNTSSALARRQSLADRLACLKEWRQDPTVLVRTTPGAAVEIFHDADEPCGRARNRTHFEELLLGEARARGLEPCSACGVWVGREVLDLGDFLAKNA